MPTFVQMDDAAREFWGGVRRELDESYHVSGDEADELIAGYCAKLRERQINPQLVYHRGIGATAGAIAGTRQGHERELGAFA